MSEAKSSSGVILATRRGMTGQAKSIKTGAHDALDVAPDTKEAAFLVRETWPGRHSSCTLWSGVITVQIRLAIASRIKDGEVTFADGIEQDLLRSD